METETETGTAATRGRAQEDAREPVPAQEIFITVSDALEYLFCPRFIFFERCLMIPEHQEKRYKVLKGRELHEVREKVNRDYVRKKLNCTRKEISVYLTSHKYIY
jgi:CRISPR-associated exonuclease Cas4